jgi:tRNA(Arg) A34 adenosine deaminase TadA
VKPTDLAHLTRAVELAALARSHGNHPFGAILVTAAGDSVEAENTVVTDRDPTGHAETNLVRKASAVLDRAALATATLYTSTEPCAMCCGAIFWAGIGRVVYALPETALLELVPAGSDEGLLDLPSREVFARGGRQTEVIGPIETPGAREVHAGFWV